MKRIALSALITVVLSSSAGLAQAATSTASSGSWLDAFNQLMMCATTSPMACMSAQTSTPPPDPNTTTDPCIKNK